MPETLTSVSQDPPLAKPYTMTPGEKVAKVYERLTNGYTHEAISRYSEKYLTHLSHTLEDISDAVAAYQDIKLDEIKDDLTNLHLEGASEAQLNEALPTVFALFHHALDQTTRTSPDAKDGQTPYDVQLKSALVMNDGKLAEMRTSEGKTYALEIAAVLNALTKKGVYVVTADSYLACRDLSNLGATYDALGLNVAVITDQLDDEGHQIQYMYDSSYLGDHPDPELPHLRRISREEAYQADITYGVPSEFIFDYLDDRQRLVKIQRPMNCALVDEAHNTLIEQAMQPFIKSQKEELTPERRTLLLSASRLPFYLEKVPDYNPQVKEEPTQGDFYIPNPEDQVGAVIALTESGDKKVRTFCKSRGIDYDDPEVRLAMDNALKAHFLWHKDTAGGYIINIYKGEIVLTHPQTGRPLQSVRLSNGLHQAIEAKEGVHIQPDNIITDSITAMQYFKMFPKLGATTGTAEDYAELFEYFYKLQTIIIPTRNTIRMKRYQTRGISFHDEDRMIEGSDQPIPGLFSILAQDAQVDVQEGRPVLIGLSPGNVAKADALYAYFQKAFAKEIANGTVKLQVIHAKQDAKEHEVVKQMGESGVITIAAGYAALGADPKLGAVSGDHDKINGAGGLSIYAIDTPELLAPLKQLIGRGGRTGDNGRWRLYVTRDSQLLSRLSEEQIQQLADEWDLRSNRQAQANDPNFAARLDAMIESIQRQNVSKLKEMLDQNLRVQEVIDRSRARFDERLDYLRTHTAILPLVMETAIKQTIDAYFPNSSDFPDPGHDDGFFESLIAKAQKLIPDLTAEEFDYIFDTDEFKKDDDIYKKRLTEIALKRYHKNVKNHATTLEEQVTWQYMLYHRAVNDIWDDHRNTIQNIFSTLQIAQIPRPLDELTRRMPSEIQLAFNNLRYYLTRLMLTHDEEEPKEEEISTREPHEFVGSLSTPPSGLTFFITN